MKKQGWILIGITGLFFCLLLGVFIGRYSGSSYIPVKNVLNQQSQPTGSQITEPININTASLQQLSLLPGIGDVLGQKIIDYREKYGDFRAIEELMNISGITEKKFAEFRNYITVK